MEYLLGSLVTLISVVVLNRLLRKSLSENNFSFNLSQSYLFKMLSDYADHDIIEEDHPKTQAFKHVLSNYIKIMIIDNQAYWIKDNQLYTADFKDGEVDKDTTREVDTMSMSPVELKRTMLVVEKLSEGKTDDFGSPGKS